MAKLTVIAVSKQGGGKGSAKAHLKERYGADSCRFSTPMRAVCDAAEIPQTRAELQKLAQVFRQAYGEDFWEQLMLKRCKASSADIMIVDGAREKGDIMTLMTDPSSYMIYFSADKSVRKARMMGRGENVGETEMTDEEFERAENHPNELAIEEMVAWVRETYPDKIVEIDNNGTWDETAGAIDTVLTRLLRG